MLKYWQLAAVLLVDTAGRTVALVQEAAGALCRVLLCLVRALLFLKQVLRKTIVLFRLKEVICFGLSPEVKAGVQTEVFHMRRMAEVAVAAAAQARRA